MINLQILENIKSAEAGRPLKILVINESLSIPIEDQLALKGLGEVTVATGTPMEARESM